MDRGAWQATVHGDARIGHDLVTKPPSPRQYVKLKKKIKVIARLKGRDLGEWRWWRLLIFNNIKKEVKGIYQSIKSADLVTFINKNFWEMSWFFSDISSVQSLNQEVLRKFPQVSRWQISFNTRYEKADHIIFKISGKKRITWDFSSVQSLSHVQFFETTWTTASQASLSITNSWSSLKLMSTESVMPSNHLILFCPFLLLPSILPSIRVFSNESVLCITWPKYWSFSFNISPSNEHSGLISFRMDRLDLLAV